jgi:hypothetical protein
MHSRRRMGTEAQQPTLRRLLGMRLIRMPMGIRILMPTLIHGLTCMGIRTTTAAGDKPASFTWAPISDHPMVQRWEHAFCA